MYNVFLTPQDMFMNFLKQIFNFVLNRDLYSFSEPPKGGPDLSKYEANNTPVKVPLRLSSEYILSTYFSRKDGLMAQKKVCSKIRS